MEETTVMLVGLNLERIIQGIKILENQTKVEVRGVNPVLHYQVPNVSEKIVRILHSYVDYVNRVTWKLYE